MLDTFEILTTSGVVLWSRSYTSISASIINSFIASVFIEEQALPGAGAAEDTSAAENPLYKHDQHTVKWTMVKELNIIFVVGIPNMAFQLHVLVLTIHSQAVYRSLLHLSWIDKLVDNIKTLFVDLYGDQLRKPHTTIVECHFDDYFDQQLRELEKTAINQDPRVAEDSALLEKAPPSVTQDVKDEPPPLPAYLKPRGMIYLCKVCSS